MDLTSKLIFSVLADWQNHILRKLLIDLLFEIIDGNEWTLQMFDIAQHVERIPQRH